MAESILTTRIQLDTMRRLQLAKVLRRMTIQDIVEAALRDWLERAEARELLTDA